MVAEGAVRVLGTSPFHDTTLAASGRLSYLGGNWDRDIAFAGYSIPLQVLRVTFEGILGFGEPVQRAEVALASDAARAAQGDFPAQRMLDSVLGLPTRV